MLFTDALDGYWLANRREFSQHTERDYELTFRRLSAYAGADAHIEHINTGVIRAFLNHIADEYKLSDKTRSNAWVALSSLWTWAAIELKIPHVIRDRITRPKYRRPQIETYTQVEVQAMLNACDKAAQWHSKNGKPAISDRPTALRDKAIIITLVDTGLRASELCNLTIADYDKATGHITVRQGKGKKDRTVYASENASQAIWRYKAARGPGLKPGDPLFATATNQPLDRNNLRHTIQSAAKRAGLDPDGVTVHRFRHTFAVNFLRNGSNVLALQALLGHERMDTVKIYVKLSDIDLQQEQSKASVAAKWRLK